jgi:phage terminase large subunit-like protein
LSKNLLSPVSRRSVLKLGLLAATIGSRDSLLGVLPNIAALNSTGSFDFSRLSAQQTSQVPSPSSQPPWTFRDFIPEAWQIVEPATPFIGGYHVDAIAEHLQAISDGDLQNLIINMPPRHTKSTFVGVLWPAWEWTVSPYLQWLVASYREALAIRDSVKCRRLMQSSWYQERWGGVFTMTGDQNEKRRYENDRSGYRVAIGVGTGTGEGGHRLVLDDPISADQAESDAYRESANDWVDGTFSTRGNDPRTVARVVVMQRLHEDDTTGHLLKKMAAGGAQYDHLVLPAEYEPTVQVCMADLEPKPIHDPRTEPGQPLSPERFGSKELDALKIDLGSDARVAGQLQQRPSPAGGLIFQREWWDGDRNRYDWSDEAIPSKVLFRYLSIDTAFKDGKQNDKTACLVGELLADYRLLVREITAERVQFHDLIDFIRSAAVRWNYDGKLEVVLIEDKGSGISALQQLRAAADPPWLAGMLRGFEPPGSKEYRARKAAIWPKRDMVLLPHPSAEAPWLLDFAGPEPQGQLFKFPNVEHDDEVDAFSQLIDYLWEILAEGYRAKGGVAA